MAWPLSQDYNEAVQAPTANFTDPDLKRGRAATNALGLPMPYSGNFADVYQFVCPDGQRWAVKCFTREVPGLRPRYEAISRHLRQAKLPFTVDFTYLEKGILVAGQWYPVLKMEWVEGLTLNQFVSQSADKPGTLKALHQVWGRMAAYLRTAEVAHADLQHGNVLLVPGAGANSLALKLVDYDGMWIPELAGRKSGEVGHPCYQHPRRLREETYSREVDRFPLLLIATALSAMQAGGRALWEKYDTGDNLLFTEVDLQAPTKSRLFYDLLHSTDDVTVTMAKRMIEALRGSLESAPLLEAVMPEGTRPAKTSVASKPQALPVEEKGPPRNGPPVQRPIIGPRRNANRRGVPALVWVGGIGALVLIATMGAAWVALRDKGAPSPVALNKSSDHKRDSSPQRPPQPPKDGSPKNDNGPPRLEKFPFGLRKKEPLYRVVFDAPQTDWPVAKDDSQESGYADGVYYIKTIPGHKVFRRSLYTAPDEFACEVVGRLQGGPGNGWGLTIGSQIGGTGRSMRIALRDGKVGVGKFPDLKDDPEDGPQFNPAMPSSLNPVTEWNTLLVVVRKGQAEVYVNDVLIRKPFRVPGAITPAHVYLSVLCPVSRAAAEFQRLSVWSAKDLPPAPDEAGLLDWEPQQLPVNTADHTTTPPAEDGNAFFNGKDLTGWEGLEGYWTVKEGAIVGKCPSEQQAAHTFLISKKKYKDFDLRFKVWRKYGLGRTAVQFRSQIKD